MGYAVPSFVKGLIPNKPSIILADDYNRANPMILNAFMEIICRQEYISWKLPKNTTIIMSQNPDDGAYMTNSQDSAMQTRYLNFNIKWDVDDWAKWGENAGLDNRCLNFMLLYSSELMKRTPNGASIMNARSYTMFANIIGGLENWEDPKTLAMIMQIASGCFLDEDNVVGTYFTLFIKNKLDKLISPKDMLLGDWSAIKGRIRKCVYDDYDNYHPEIASVLATRLLNYTLLYFDTKGNESKKVQERLLEIIDSDIMLFSEDLIFNVVKTLAIKNAARMNKLMLHPKIRAKMF